MTSKTLKCLLVFSCYLSIKAAVIAQCNKEINHYETNDLGLLVRSTIPSLLHGNTDKRKGDAGKIGVIGGSVEYTGAPYFTAITSLKVGADITYVITTESAAPVIKSYSPELIVYPFLDKLSANKIPDLLKKMDVVIIGPGLGRDPVIMDLVSEIMITCRSFKKPLVVDADGLYLISTNLSLIQNYPDPGVILLPNQVEAARIKKAMKTVGIPGFEYLGNHTSVLEKGSTDNYIAGAPNMGWFLKRGGSGRRAGGQGDILAGAVGTLFNWGLKSYLCDKMSKGSLAASVATFGAAKLTRSCNEKAFKLFGRSMTASDMLTQIHVSFDEHLENFSIIPNVLSDMSQSENMEGILPENKIYL